jgi:two-component system response regulator FixJ
MAIAEENFGPQVSSAVGSLKLTPIVIIDDDPVVADSLAVLINAGGYSTRIFHSAEDFLSELGTSCLWCVITDHRLPHMSGLELAERIRQTHAGCGVILVTGFAETPLVVRAMKSGAITVLDKPFQSAAVWAAIADAERIFHNHAASGQDLTDYQARLSTLTAAESEVLARIACGMPHKQIATELEIGLRTVELRRSKIMQKMRVDSLAELIRMLTLVGWPNNVTIVRQKN